MSRPAVAGVTLRTLETNGITMRIAEAGEGPLVLLAHGWPESWYSWRHQLTALAAAGYHAVAPDMRGYGGTDAPAAIEDYDIVALVGDVVGVFDALGADRAHLVGHDWGSMIAANTALYHPERLDSLTLMSVPYTGRPPAPPTSIFAELFGDDFFYILYHNEPGAIAETEYDADPRGFLSRLYQSPDAPREEPEIVDPKRAAGGWIPRMGAPKQVPSWQTEDDLDYLVGQFETAGFRGGVNYYRNFDRNWDLTAHLADASIETPTMFLAGDQDMVIGGADVDALRARMGDSVRGLREVVLVPGAGHWVQQETPDATNDALVAFLETVDA